MKRVLVLSYYFPPLGGVGVQGPLKFVKYLPEWGYEAIVVTGPHAAPVEWAPHDSVLEAEIPSGLKVLRAVGPPPAATGARHRMARWMGVWSPFHRWWRSEAARIGRVAVRDADIVCAMMAPFSTAAAAAAAAREGRTAWVADLQDPWALDEWCVYPTALHRSLDVLRMRRDLRSAAAIVTTTAEAARALEARFPELASSRVLTIPWGWDRDDFAGDLPRRPDGTFRIVYAGYTHLERGRTHQARRRFRTMLGGAVTGIDIVTRSHLFLVSAMERLADLDPELWERTELHIAGPAIVEDASSADGPTLHAHGYLPHDQAVALMRSADVLFLAMHDLPSGTRSRTVPGKTYEYLASGRPILAAVPDGDARDLLASATNVWLCRPSDVDAMANALVEIARIASPVDGRTALSAQFEWRELARRLASVFDEVLGQA